MVFETCRTSAKTFRFRNPCPGISPRRVSRPGFTLVEGLVVLGIISVLAAFLLPTVQGARESARRASCGNNLRQIALAVQGYQGVFAVFPSVHGASVLDSRGNAVFAKSYSLFTQILPQLDQMGLFHSINFRVSMVDPYVLPQARMSWGIAVNRTAMSTTLAVLLCPSDGGGHPPGWTGAANYRSNLGTDRWHVSIDGPLSDSLRNRSAASITDGLSHTVLFGEKLRGGADGSRFDPRRAMIVGGLGAPYTADESLAHCLSSWNDRIDSYPFSGLAWAVGTLAHTSYNHVIEPNNRIPDCVLPGAIVGIVGARSDHPGGVHVALADGSVRFVANTVSRRIWMALGSAHGGEVISPNEI